MGITSHFRPRLAFRVGVTGMRHIEADQQPRIIAQVHARLAAVRDAIVTATKDPSIRRAFGITDGNEVAPYLRIVSPLALGADRIVAREALTLGYELCVPMPFPISEYRRDFRTADDLGAFDSLFGRCADNWLAIDGDHNQAGRSYEAVGRLVARQSDLIIAVWDGEPARGRGGTEEIIRFALASGTPVVWVHAKSDTPPIWLDEPYDFLHGGTAADDARIAGFLDATLRPPKPPAHNHHDPIDRIIGWLRPRDGDPLHQYFNEEPLPKRLIWQAWGVFARWMSHVPVPWTPPRPPVGGVERYWFDRYEAANHLSSDYAKRYRSSFVWVFFLATLSLLLGAAALVLMLLIPVGEVAVVLVHALALVTGVGELIILLLILVLVLWTKAHHWHERSIEYRMLAELCRKQQTLAPLGWSLPITDVRTRFTDDVAAAPDRASWVAWVFASDQRAAPTPMGDLGATAPQQRESGVTKLVDEQIAYHVGRKQMAENGGRRLEHISFWVFVAVIVSVGIKLVLADHFEMTAAAVPFAWAATVLPGVSAAFVGIRSYAELQLLAAQSRHMLVELERAKVRVAKLDMARPLASQDLGAEASAVAMLMLQDLEGWARLFRLKGAEVG